MRPRARGRRRFAWTVAVLATAVGISCFSLAGADELPVLWPESQRAFWFEGARWLLDDDQRGEFLRADEAARQAFIDDFYGQDLEGLGSDGLERAIATRFRLASSDLLTSLDHRAQLLFLHGAPDERQVVDCGRTFRPIEIWTYGEQRPVIVYQPESGLPYRVWLPLESKRVLYTREMEYWLDQFHELRQYIRGRRFDLQLCSYTRRIDEITGVGGLILYDKKDRPRNEDFLRWLEPPDDLARWANGVLDEAAGAPATLSVEDVELQFPKEQGQRILTRIVLTVPIDERLQAFKEGEADPEYRLQLQGVLERHDAKGAQIFEDFRIRYLVKQEPDAKKLALVVDRALRANGTFQVSMRLKDEISGLETVLSRGFVVPAEPIPVPEPERTTDVVVALGDQLAEQPIAGEDDIILVPPETDVVLGLWRAEALVTGERIAKVKFLVDGQEQFSRGRRPFTAEVRLAKYPREQSIRVEGYDAQDELVDWDEILINQQRGELRVRIVEPDRGANVSGEVTAAVEITVPEERRVERVEFSVNDTVQKVLEQSPWRTTVSVPQATSAQDLNYLTVVAELDDGTRSEDVRFLNAPSYLDTVEVDFVELYTTVTDRSNQLMLGLEQSEFSVFEDGRQQEIAKFELVDDLPLTLGVTIDTSGSMSESLGEARQAAIGFLEAIMTPKDRSFAVSFADRPALLMTRTADVGAVAASLEPLRAVGSTSLYDAVVTSLYYFRGVRGRRALILLSDGEDTASSIPYRDALEYAKRSGVTIYSIGLNIGKLQVDVRGKLNELSQQTGGRTFFISRAEELRAVYAQIEKELRSQYLIAYSSDRPDAASADEFREVEVKVKGRLRARTIAGYYP